MSKKKVGKVLYWTPRIVSILFILFIALFSLDVFEPGLSLGQMIIGFLMHNIPTFALIIIVIIAWKREIVGAIAFFLAGIAYIVSVFASSDFEWYMLSWSLIIAGPAFFIAILYLLNWRRKK